MSCSAADLFKEMCMADGRLLAWEVREGSLAGVERMLNGGADVNRLGSDLIPPVVAAAILGHVDMLKLEGRI